MGSQKKITKNGLTVMENSFIEHLFATEGFNLKEAAKLAGYSKPSAAAAKLLDKPSIVARIKSYLTRRRNKLEVTGERIMEELACIGFCDIRQLFDEKGGVKPPHQWPDELAAAISSMDVEERRKANGDIVYKYRVRMNSKVSALEMLGRHLGMFIDQIQMEHTGSVEFLAGLVEKIESQKPVIIDAEYIKKAAIEKKK